MQISSHIGGDFYRTDSSFIKTNPFTGESLAQVSSCDLMGLVKAVNNGNKAAAEFKSSSLNERISFVNAIKEYLIKNREIIVHREALDQALPLFAVEKYNLQMCIANIDSHLIEVQQSTISSSNSVGLIAVIASWNFSLRQILSRIVPAILGGNAVIVKVSSQSPSTVTSLVEMITAAKIPNGLIQVIVSSDEDVKSTLCSHPGIRAVSFIGSLENGLNVLKQVSVTQAQSFKKIQMSLGTKNSAVCVDEPNDQVFESIMQSFLLGQGQLAYNSARLFVLEKYENLWIDRLQSYLNNLKPSESIEDTSLWTPVLKTFSFNKFSDIKKQAHEDQAKLIQTSVNQTNYLSPIFTRDMSRCSTLQQDQIHSPFFILSTVKYPFDVAKYSNVSYFGFAAHLWGATEKLSKIADSLEVGCICYNSWSAERARPWSATKQSGYGIQDDRAFGLFFSNSKQMY